MALDSHVIAISFAEGEDTKTDPKQVMLGKLLLLRNGRFLTSKSMRKRNGYSALGIGIQGSSPVGEGSPSLSALTANASFKSELLGFTGTELYSYSTTTTKWTDKGGVVSTDLSVIPAVRNAYSQTICDSAFHSIGMKAFIWEDSRGGVRYSVMDSNTNEYYQQDVSIDSTADRPKVFTLGNYFVFFYHDAGTTNLKFATLSITSPTSTLSFSNYATTVLNAAPNYDGVVMNNTLYIAWNNTSGGGGVSIKSIDRVLTLSSVTSKASESATNCIAVLADTTLFQVWVTYNDNTNQRAFVLSSNLGSTIHAPFTVEAQAANACTGYVNNGAAQIYYQVTASPTYNTYIRGNTATNAAVVGTAANLIYSVGLFSKPFIYNSVYYLMVSYDSSVQPMYFIINTSAAVITKIADGVGGGLPIRAQLVESYEVDTGIYGFSYLQKDLLTTVGGAGTTQSGTVNLYNQTGVMGGEIDFTSLNTFSRATIGNNLQISGGILQMYDGVSVVEQGFHLFPEAVTPTNTTSGGALVAGTYQYVGVYEWVDNFGQIHRSAPSIPTSITLPTGSSLTFTADSTAGSTTLSTVSSVAGLFIGQVITDSTSGGNIVAGTYITAVGTTTITLSAAAVGTRVGDTYATVYTNSESVSVPTLRITQKKPTTRTPISVVLYRTQVNQTVFYRVSSVSSPTVNSITANTVTITDHTSDVSAAASEILYTTGGVVENIAPPAISLVTTYGNRAMAVTAEDPLTFWYSKEIQPNIPPQFNDSFTQTVDARIGAITAHSQMDDKYITFGPESIYYMTGQGPANTGAQNDFSQNQLITTDVGCSNPRSVITMPLGLMFQSGKGIYLLNRGLGTQYIGADVEAYNNTVITGAVLVPNTNEVRFTTNDGITLTYDYFFKQWSIDEVQYGVDACIFQNLFTYANPNGTMYQETIGTYLDSGSFYPLKIWTAWLSFAQLQGFQRIWQVNILGEYESPHSLSVKLAYDFNPAPTQEELIDATSIIGTTAYGDDATYGSGTPYGGTGMAYQFRILPNQQKSQSLQLQIEDIQTEEFGEGMRLSGLTFELGLKKGTYKSGATTTFS